MKTLTDAIFKMEDMEREAKEKAAQFPENNYLRGRAVAFAEAAATLREMQRSNWRDRGRDFMKVDGPSAREV